jgi:hypothetical protein
MNHYAIRAAGPKRWEIVPTNGKRGAIITNTHDGSCVTILVGRKCIVFAKRISNYQMNDEFIRYIMSNICGFNSNEFIDWLEKITEEEVDMLRVVASMDKE